MLNLSTKPDAVEACTRWEHFWHGELYDRPLVQTSVPRQGVPVGEVVDLYALRYYLASQPTWDQQLALIIAGSNRSAFQAI